MTELLSGIRVLDLTNVLAGPYCAYQLALLGADVIKVEAPQGGDLARQLGGSPKLNSAGMGASFLAQNAGKRSVVLDLKQQADRERFFDLVASADALVENFRPGVMDRLGLGYEALKTVRPGLVYCAISGFGQTGPMRDNPAYDQIIQGLSGIMSITGTPETAPLRVGYPVADTLGGLVGAFAITSALVRQKTSGEGAFLDVSMLECTLSALGWPVSNYLTAGIDPKPMGNENMTAAPSGTFRTGDGLVNIAANKQEQFVALCRLIGRPELASDVRFAERETRKRNRAALKVEIEDALAGASAAAWEEMLNRAGVPAGRVLTIPQVLAEPQVLERRVTANFDDVAGMDKPLTVLRGGFMVDGEAPLPTKPPPALGEHMGEVFADLPPRGKAKARA
ncbi:MULTISPECIES: CaiB/BaiF CoA-transferase family protein [unclassified Mesorhizobium]|uniref:CaiB/BaiF CoA transferase family protein n=1 Tax=unclassified Mesorhizobium TaxID=325217 RepID=UPI000FCA62B3|nr:MULTISPECIES: CoA transferase [unclassified Mesorhizobium]RVD17008.1 CoA transferase [Mesorhizobium sp. M7A.F.Ca.ET.027.02.1.1]RVD64188.1 CoA transferase [Mesorhizobium sp. M7A.F.Ca.ET.027.03.2.1]RWD08671.1 MAG: CoA transferase [Mesorhizobium sp.]RWP88793.1 MAG: CoA transferase [Mesorhizobium sp.]RWQ15117.1 MAG: CoA transferase [Mesorhizobium sp.]